MLEEDLPRGRGGGVMARTISKAGGAAAGCLRSREEAGGGAINGTMVTWLYKHEGPLANKGCEWTHALKELFCLLRGQ